MSKECVYFGETPVLSYLLRKGFPEAENHPTVVPERGGNHELLEGQMGRRLPRGRSAQGERKTIGLH